MFDFLGDSIKLPCTIEGGIAIIAGAGVPIVGKHALENGPAMAFARPDAFTISTGDAPGIAARVRNVLLAGPDARIDCGLEGGGALEVRLDHEAAAKLSPRDRISLLPRAVRVWHQE